MDIKKVFLASTFVLSFILLLFSNFNFGTTQFNEKYLEYTKIFQFTECSDYIGNRINMNSLNFSLPSSTWNITKLDVNLTNIKLGKEVKTIEEGGSSFKAIFKSLDGYGVQMNVTEDLLLFGVYVYGYISPPGLEPISEVRVQINGFDVGTNTPNSTRYGDYVPLNMTNVPDWYIQKFTEPIQLKKGYYYLVLNGSGYVSSDNTEHNWYYNGDDSLHSFLYTSKLDKGSWSIEDQGSPFRYKLIQRTNRSYKPEDINMTTIINDQIYNITNGETFGSGRLSIKNLNIHPNSSFFWSSIQTNISVELIFNLSYGLNLRNYLSNVGNIKIEENEPNQWALTPLITRTGKNYSVGFCYPDNWYDIIIERNSIDITSQIIIDETAERILIMNETIRNGDDWLITAKSLNIVFELDLRRTEFSGGQELKFALKEPILPGNYTFILYDSLGFPANESFKQLPGDSLIYTYKIPTTPNEGTFKIYIYWYDSVNAGVITQEFNVTRGLDIFLVIMIVFIIFIFSGLGVTSYVIVKRSREKSRLEKEKIIKRAMDILNLQYFMLIEKSGSLNVFEQVYSKKSIDPTLITGFLSAIHSFGIELTNSEENAQTIKLEYKDSKILMSEFKHFRLILIMRDIPSELFLNAVSGLAREIEDKFGIILKDFKGNKQPFEEVEKLVINHLNTSILYPLKVSRKKGIRLNSIEKIVYERAVLKIQNSEHVFTSQLLSTRKFSYEIFEAIISLIDKGILEPIL